MSDTTAQKTTQLFVKLVAREDFDSAWASSRVLSKFGITLIIFHNGELMHRWLASIRHIRGLSVRVFQDLKVPHV